MIRHRRRRLSTRTPARSGQAARCLAPPPAQVPKQGAPFFHKTMADTGDQCNRKKWHSKTIRARPVLASRAAHLRQARPTAHLRGHRQALRRQQGGRTRPAQRRTPCPEVSVAAPFVHPTVSLALVTPLRRTNARVQWIPVDGRTYSQTRLYLR